MNINKLSIVLPTYNRSDFIDASLAHHLPLCRIYNIDIFISDNNSEDETEKIVLKWKESYSNLYYYKNSTNLGVDLNIEKALKLARSDYVWLLGDSYKANRDVIKYVVEFLDNDSNNVDAIVLNVVDQIKHVSTQNFMEHNSLLSNIGVMMTCVSCVIYKSEIIKHGNFEIFRRCNYLQTGIILDYISSRKFIIHWSRDYSVFSFEKIIKQKKTWSLTEDVFQIAAVNWVDFILTLPTIFNFKTKIKCIQDFSKYSGVFSIRHFIILRSLNILNISSYRKYSDYFKLMLNYYPIIILFISIMPVKVAKSARTFAKFIKQ